MSRSVMCCGTCPLSNLESAFWDSVRKAAILHGCSSMLFTCVFFSQMMELPAMSFVDFQPQPALRGLVQPHAASPSFMQIRPVPVIMQLRPASSSLAQHQDTLY